MRNLNTLIKLIIPIFHIISPKTFEILILSCYFFTEAPRKVNF